MAALLSQAAWTMRSKAPDPSSKAASFTTNATNEAEVCSAICLNASLERMPFTGYTFCTRVLVSSCSLSVSAHASSTSGRKISRYCFMSFVNFPAKVIKLCQ